MVQHILGNRMAESAPYIDDVLSSTGKLPPGEEGKGKLLDSQAYCHSDPRLPDGVEESGACSEHDYEICFCMFKAFADAGLTGKPRIAFCLCAK